MSIFPTAGSTGSCASVRPSVVITSPAPAADDDDDDDDADVSGTSGNDPSA
jgi:hypothetical protein